jgi:hypothetical protein
VTHEKGHQVHKVEHEMPYEPIEEHFDEAHYVEDAILEEGSHEDKTSVVAPLSKEDEVIQAPIPSAHEEENEVSYTPFQVFDVASFHDLESEEVLEEPLDALHPSCYNKCANMIENIDDFIHLGRPTWDMNCFSFDGDPI